MMKMLMVCTMVVLGWTAAATASLLSSDGTTTTTPVKIAQVGAKEYSIRGFLKAERGDHLGAIADFNQALKLDPQNADVYYNRAISRSALGDATGSIADFTRSIQLASDNSDAYFNRGLILASIGQYTKAIGDYNEAIDLYELRAMLLLLLGDSPQLIVQPSLPYLYYNRGLARYNLGDRTSTLKDFQQAANLALTTGNQEFHQYLRTAIDQLR